jgi:membrane protein
VDSTKRPSLIQRVRQRQRWLDHLIRAGVRYTDNHGDHYAAAIAYFSVLALFPLLMIAFSVVGFVLFKRPELVVDLKAAVTEAAPAGVGSALDPLLDRAVASRTTVGVIGLLGAAYSGLGWMNNLREALSAQWAQQHEKGSFVRTKAVDALALLGLGLALIVSLGLTAAGAGLTAELAELLGLSGLWWVKALLGSIAVLLALVGNWLVFLWMIAGLPRQPVPLRSAVKAAVLGAVGFEILKQATRLYLGSLSGPAGAIFGPVIGLLVFAFLVSRFILFVTAWAATDAATEQRAVQQPVAMTGPISRPAVVVHSGPDGRTATGLVCAGAVFGLGLAWLLRRR